MDCFFVLIMMRYLIKDIFDDGMIVISDSLDEATKVFLNINETIKIALNEGQQKYMK